MKNGQIIWNIRIMMIRIVNKTFIIIYLYNIYIYIYMKYMFLENEDLYLEDWDNRLLYKK